MKIVIPKYRAVSRNKTATSHWRNYVQFRNEIADFIHVYATEKIVISPARVTIEAYYMGARVVDTSNIDDKMIVDGLMKAGILRDDTPAENPEVIKRSFGQAERNELVITVEKIGA